MDLPLVLLTLYGVNTPVNLPPGVTHPVRGGHARGPPPWCYSPCTGWTRPWTSPLVLLTLYGVDTPVDLPPGVTHPVRGGHARGPPPGVTHPVRGGHAREPPPWCYSPCTGWTCPWTSPWCYSPCTGWTRPWTSPLVLLTLYGVDTPVDLDHPHITKVLGEELSVDGGRHE